MYLWHILCRDTKELTKKVYEAQTCKSNKGDWIQIMQEERQKCDVLLSHETISKMSQKQFRKLIKKKVHSHAVNYIHELAGRQAYFSDRRFSKFDVQFLFTLRSKMLNCKLNFQNQFSTNLSCRKYSEEDSPILILLRRLAIAFHHIRWPRCGSLSVTTLCSIYILYGF